MQDFVNKMEFKRKCFLGHKPDKIKEGKLAYKKRMEEMKDLASSAAVLDVGEAADKGKGTPSPPATLPHTQHHNDSER